MTMIAKTTALMSALTCLVFVAVPAQAGIQDNPTVYHVVKGVKVHHNSNGLFVSGFGSPGRFADLDRQQRRSLEILIENPSEKVVRCVKRYRSFTLTGPSRFEFTRATIRLFENVFKSKAPRRGTDERDSLLRVRLFSDGGCNRYLSTRTLRPIEVASNMEFSYGGNDLSKSGFLTSKMDWVHRSGDRLRGSHLGRFGRFAAGRNDGLSVDTTLVFNLHENDLAKNQQLKKIKEIRLWDVFGRPIPKTLTKAALCFDGSRRPSICGLSFSIPSRSVGSTLDLRIPGTFNARFLEVVYQNATGTVTRSSISKFRSTRHPVHQR